MRTSKLTRDLQSRKTRQKIMDASIFLFQEKGYEAATVKDICKKAGVSNGSFYHFYHSKENILMELSADIASFNFGLSTDVDEKAKDPEKWISLYFEEYARFWEGLGVNIVQAIYRIFDKVYLNEDDSFKQLDSYTELENFIQAAQNAGTFTTEMTAHEAMRLFYTFYRGQLLEWSFRQGSYSIMNDSKPIAQRKNFLHLFCNRVGGGD